MPEARTAAAIVGLVVAVGGTVLLASPASRLLGDPDRLSTRITEQLTLWALFATILAIVLGWERLPLASIALEPFHWTSLAWGVALALTLVYVAVPIAMRVLAASGLPGFESGIAKVVALPVWFRIFAVVTAGVVEETLFRGYFLERVATLSGSYWVAGILTVVVFALVHLPFWGPGPVLTLFITGGVMTAFFIWRQDLLANIVAHVIVDAVGLIITPWLSASSREGG